MNIIGTGPSAHPVHFTPGQSPDCSNFTPGANLRYCHLGGLDLDGFDLAGADLTGAKLVYTSFDGADLDGAIFDNTYGSAVVNTASLVGAQMVGASFAGVYLEDNDFGEANLTDASFTARYSPPAVFTMPP